MKSRDENEAEIIKIRKCVTRLFFCSVAPHNTNLSSDARSGNG